MNDYCEGRHTDCYRDDCGCLHHDSRRAKVTQHTEMDWTQMLTRIDALVAEVRHETR